MVLPLHQFCHLWWVEICKKIKKAVVFIDNNAAECLHWNGGLMDLISAGAVAVKEFSSFECGLNNQKKAVFITCSPIHGTAKTILRDLIQGSSFEYCVLITAAHSSVHQFARYGNHRDPSTDMQAFHNLEEDMLRWMGNMNYTVEIFYFPLFAVSVTESLFLTPPFSELFPFLESDLPDIKTLYQLLYRGSEKSCFDSLSSLEMSVLPVELQIKIEHFVSCLHSLFAQWDMREDIYSLGPYSGLLATQLENLPVANKRRRTASNRCSLILVDRTLDLSSVTMYSTDAMLDKILLALPHLPGHSNDVAVNMSPLCNAVVDSVDENILAPGCLVHPKSESCTQVLEWLFRKKQKDILHALFHSLNKAMPSSTDDNVTKLVTHVYPHTIEKQIGSFKGHADKILQNSGLLQQALAVVQTLTSPRLSELEVLVSIEKLLLGNLSISKDGSAVLAQMSQLLKTKSEKELQLEDLLSLLVYMYSLVGCDIKFSVPAEANLKGALQQCFMEEKDNTDSKFSTLFHSGMTEADVSEITSEFFCKLKSVSNARKDLLKYKSLFKIQSSSEPVTRITLLQQLVSDLLDPTRPDIPDLSCKSAGLKDLLKSGFSLLLNLPRQQHPCDNPLVVVFIVGGVTAEEVRLVEETVAHYKPDSQVLVGSTRLITPADIVHTLTRRKLS